MEVISIGLRRLFLSPGTVIVGLRSEFSKVGTPFDARRLQLSLAGTPFDARRLEKQKKEYYFENRTKCNTRNWNCSTPVKSLVACVSMMDVISTSATCTYCFLYHMLCLEKMETIDFVTLFAFRMRTHHLRPCPSVCICGSLVRS